MEARRFSHIWNEILKTFREEDLISDRGSFWKQVLAAAMKFTYVVAAQIYGAQKKSGANQAKGIAYLLKEYKGLRIAFVDEVETVYIDGLKKTYHSVLVKYDREAQMEMEIFRVELLEPLKLGEGKPENQKPCSYLHKRKCILRRS